jgi:hypothetical protein
LVWVNFRYLGVFGEYGKILLAFSPYAVKYFLRILEIITHVVEKSTVLCETFDAQVPTQAVANFDGFLCVKFN